MGEPHEIDRRFNDQEFKLRITGEIREIKVNLDHNTAETKLVREKVDELSSEVERTLKGTGPLDTGLVGQTLSNKVAIEGLEAFLKKWLPIIGVGIVIFADQLSPIVRNWLSEKTHLAIFRDPVQEWKDDKQTKHVKVYHVHVNQDE